MTGSLSMIMIDQTVVSVALPATSQASSKVVNTYNVTVKKGILDSGSTVKAKAVIANGAAQQSSWWSQGMINQVGRTGVHDVSCH